MIFIYEFNNIAFCVALLKQLAENERSLNVQRELYGNRNKKLKRARLRAYDAFLRLLILPRMHNDARTMHTGDVR
jgi:hypothetical protein